MLSDQARLRYLNLLPHPADAPHSSLAYMMQRISQQRGCGESGWYMRGDVLLLERLLRDLREAVEQRQAVCLAGTAFAFVHLLDGLSVHECTLHLPVGSRIMETGGFKGRSRIVARETLYAQLSEALGIPSRDIVAEYGMTELTSQYYDTPHSRQSNQRVKSGPPWLRAVITRGGRVCAQGELGVLTHVDLANRSSTVAVATEDVAVVLGDGFRLVGREESAEPRGCSLEAEDLQHA